MYIYVSEMPIYVFRFKLNISDNIGMLSDICLQIEYNLTSVKCMLEVSNAYLSRVRNLIQKVEISFKPLRRDSEFNYVLY